MQRRYEEELAAAEIMAGVSIEGASDLRNAETVREELKKSVIAMLYADPGPVEAAEVEKPFIWEDLISRANPRKEPAVEAEKATRRAATIQFLEQAFEWEKLTYVLYPYFWADRKSKWTTMAALEGDSEFVRFQRSGSARVVVSARPLFEDHVDFFLDFGIVWSGGPVPTALDPDYLSLADEIKASQRAPDKAERGEWWDVKLPTSLVWLDGAAALPEKPKEERELGPPPEMIR